MLSSPGYDSCPSGGACVLSTAPEVIKAPCESSEHVRRVCAISQARLHSSALTLHDPKAPPGEERRSFAEGILGSVPLVPHPCAVIDLRAEVSSSPQNTISWRRFCDSQTWLH